MTILPKKAEEESDSDGDNSAGSPHESSPHGAAGHAPLGSPNTPEEGGYHSPDGFYHRRYDLSSSSGESSPELSKRLTYRSPPAATASGTQGKKPLDTSPGYNSSEEYDGSRRPYMDPERERQFENALRKERGLIIKKMRPDGACLFRAVADQVYGDQEMHSVVRNHCMDYMMKNADYFSQYISDEGFEHYINRKRMDQCYGNNIEMQAIAEMYNRPIEVFQYTTEPINIFFGVYKTDNAPLRLSYHGSIHYNSVIDPYKATIGVGLGLAGHKPGVADKMQMNEAQRESENIHIEQAMLEDKKRSSDWEATYDAIEEAVARESYLTWLRENEKRTLPERHAGSQPSSSACRGNSPPMPSTSYSPIPQMTRSPVITSATRKSSISSNYRGSPSTVHTKAADMKHVKSHSSVLNHVMGTPSPSHTHHHCGGIRRFTPSPPSSSHHRGGSGMGTGMGGGGGMSTHRNAPYYSPRDSPRNTGGGRGSARNSPHSPDSPRNNGGGAIRSSARNSPHTSPRNSLHCPEDVGVVTSIPVPGGDLSTSLCSQSPLHSPNRSPTAMRRPLVISDGNNSVGSQLPHSCNTNCIVISSLEGREELNASPVPALHSPPLERTLNLFEGSSSSSHPPPLSAHPAHDVSLTGSTLPQMGGSQSPPHTLDFEDGRVLSQLPYEYSSFLDLPPSALGLSEWEDDRILAAVLAASQQEYIDSLRRSRTPGAEGH